MRVCNRCKEAKQDSEYHKNKASRDGLSGRCKPCALAYNREWSAADPENYKKVWQRAQAKNYNPLARRVRRYGITVEQYNTLLEKQNGLCAICSIKPMGWMYIDHCHNSKVVRGLLCLQCNTGLGNFRDNPDLLDKAKQYLAAVA